MAKQCGINVRENTAVFVSNSSLYNCNDVNTVIDAMTYSGFDKKGVLLGSKSVINGTDTIKPYLTDVSKDYLERFIVLSPGQRVGVNDIEVQALKTVNKDLSALGFKIFTQEFTITYCSDTKYSVEIAEQYKGSNILIFNYLNSEKKENPGLSREDIIKIVNKVNPRLVILTHFGINVIESDPLYESREIQKKTGIQTIMAKDGMVISPTSYSADKGQRTLQGIGGRETEMTIAEEPKQEVEQEDVVDEKQETIPEVDDNISIEEQ